MTAALSVEVSAARSAMEAATAAVENLTKDSLSAIKTLDMPHDHIKVVGKAAIILLLNEYEKTDWDHFIEMLGDPDKFRQDCIDLLA